MKTIFCILLATLLIAPAVCIACDLETITTNGQWVRHYASIPYWVYTDASTPTEFSSLFATAVANWREHAALGIYIPTDPETEIEMQVGWLDTSANPWDPYDKTLQGLARTWTYFDGTTGNIYLVVMRFPSDHLYGVEWDWSNTCPATVCPGGGPCNPVNIVTVMMHEIGHAIGFCLNNEHVGSGSVMSSYNNNSTCYTDLQTTDIICAQEFYPGIPISRCAEFTPVLLGSGVSIKWRTEYEYEASYFVLEKKQPNGAFAPISGVITSSGSAHVGADYEYFDPTGTRSDTYRLMEVGKNGIQLGIAGQRVVLTNPSGKAPIVLSEMERTELHKEIATKLKELIRAGEKAGKVATGEGVQWLAIYPAAFSDAIAPLITYRNYHGYNSSGVTYEYILSSYGTIKAYLQYLWNSQGHALKYMVIVGNDQLIPAERCNDGDVGGGFYANYYTDVITVDLTGDWLPELSVGRIPAGSADEVLLYVDKVVEYEGQAPADWNNDITFFVEDRNGLFAYQSGRVAAHFAEHLTELVPPTRSLHYKNILASLPYDQCRQRSQAIDEFNAGRGTVLAFGSMADYYDLVGWLSTHEFYEGCAFADTQLAPSHKYAFVLGASCDIGDMNSLSSPWILKELLFQRYSGAIACFAPSGATLQRANYDICAGILNYLYSFGTPTVGYACYSAQKHEMADDVPGYAHTARSYLFYGDPAIRLKGSIAGDPPTVTVTDPDGGESYHSPEAISITWGVQDDDLAGMRCTVLITYDTGGGMWTVLATGKTVDGYGNGHYDYTIPYGILTYTHCRVQVLATDVCNNQGTDVSNGDFTIELRAKPNKEEPIPIEEVSRRAGIPKKDFLSSPFPNPFNPNTSIGFGLKEPAHVSLVIYDVAGSVVKVLYRNAFLTAGEYVEIWDGRNDKGSQVASGIYFLQLKTGNFSRTQRMIMLR